MSTATTPRERPILFSGPMVRAILDGRKTQTRRVILHRHAFETFHEKCTNEEVAASRREVLRLDDAAPHRADCVEHLRANCRFGAPGDTLWVRETWRTEERASDLVDGIRFAADDTFVPIAPTRAAADEWIDAHDNRRHGTKWRPSIFMPRWASRLTLRVTSVRVERLQEISELDAIAEGVSAVDIPPDEYGPWRVGYMFGKDDGKTGLDVRPQQSFERGWDTINGKRAPWASNPWLWVIGFERVAVEVPS